jgi:hypothetical protein
LLGSTAGTFSKLIYLYNSAAVCPPDPGTLVILVIVKV